MYHFSYQVFLSFYQFAILLVSPFNQKAKQWFNGRKNLFTEIKQAVKGNPKIIWMHCSSLGEFEQGRPVIQKLRKQYTDHKILITFFSPSGYEVQKNYNGADYIFYLPLDSKRNAALFLDLVKPVFIIYVKYEFWYYYLHEAKNRNIPIILISAIFRKSQPFFTFYGKFHRSMLQCFNHLFVQNTESVHLLESIGIQNVSIAGDTRYDRVIEITENCKPLPEIERFCGQLPVIVAGSTWTEDDKELDHYANTRSNIKFIIAPHNIEKDRIKECLYLYKNAVLFSSLSHNEDLTDKNILIIDNIGMLSKLYRYATICYIGGGFGADGVHNVLEAAVYGKPVIFGPEYDKYLEAIELIEQKGAISVETALELEKLLDNLIQQNTDYIHMCNASKQFVYSKQGAAEKIMEYIYANRLLTT